ncbi:hypothetical protein Pcinc_029272 [Petrolisthes cinctipes]|uniref:Uncharacterized protein n=1 Tax=Petrolisthes cinctipes TaxID=88211 RepID=A0AAE1K831_PETCI|nr:hypothetical protein Pcinc_029272 [Petrolisthes cinctipes]
MPGYYTSMEVSADQLIRPSVRPSVLYINGGTAGQPIRPSVRTIHQWRYCRPTHPSIRPSIRESSSNPLHFTPNEVKWCTAFIPSSLVDRSEVKVKR